MNAVIADLAALLDLAQSVVWAAALVFIRTGAVVALMPGLGETAVPQRIKLALVVALTLVVAPMVTESIAANGPEPALATLAGEAVAGLILGIGMRLYLLALLTAASIIAQATTLSQLFAGAAPEPQPAIGNLLAVAGVALALAAGLHVTAAELIVRSYQILPAGGYPDPGQVADWGLGLISETFGLAFALAAAFVIGGTIYNLALGAINRAMPQLMVSMIGAPALTLGSLALLAIAVPLILTVWLDAFSAHVAQPFGPPR
jgi:flagellar biosynthetic protein FliR